MDFQLVRHRLHEWFRQNGRQLPWRGTQDPYCVWLSEIILQQTRVAQGMDYYRRFISRFPDVESLARAPESEVLRLWQGLGYYSRARNLHAAARQVTDEHGGTFPCTYESIRALKGVGPYTAAAIGSIAFNLPVAAVDGNVYRVLSRLMDVDVPIDTTAGQKLFAELADRLLDPQQAGLHNQAMMDFGAMQCVPANPQCGTCVLLDLCEACAAGTVGQRPVKQGKKRVKERFFTYLLLTDAEGRFPIVMRQGRDIWQHLYELPLVESDHLLSAGELMAHPTFSRLVGKPSAVNILRSSPTLTHQLTHYRIHACCHLVEINSANHNADGCVWVDRVQLDDYPISRLTERLLESLYINKV